MSGTFFTETSITPTEILAGDSDEFIIRLVIGPAYTAGNSRLLLDFSGRLGSSCPTRLLNEASGYVETYVSNPEVTYTMRIWDMSRHYFVGPGTPASREGGRMLVVDLSEGLKEGDLVEIHWGETTRGFGPGAKVTSVVPKPDYRDSIRLRYFDSHEKGLPDYGRDIPSREDPGSATGMRPDEFCVIQQNQPGCTRPEPVAEFEFRFKVLPRPLKRLRLIRQWDKARLIPHDTFWNVAEIGSCEEIVETDSPATRNEQGIFEFKNPHAAVRSKTAPLIDSPAMDNVFEGMNLYWGDLHTHSCYSSDCTRTVRMEMTPGELMRFARDRAGLDFYAVSDHHVPLAATTAMLTREAWEHTLADVAKHNDPGHFVVFSGLEFSDPRGDTILIFRDDPGFELLNRNWQDLRDLWRLLKDHDYMTIPHFHTAGARLNEGTWWTSPDMKNEPVIEILSDHGSYERENALESGRADCKSFRFDRCGVYFLKNGHRYGFVGHSDDHKGHVGVNALTAVLAESLDRESIFEAYRARRTYATSNARIRLVFTANGQLMGSVIPNTGKKVIGIDVAGESNLKKVDLFRNGDLYQRFAPQGLTFRQDVCIEEDGPSNWYVRVTQLDNHVAIASPIWFE